MPSWPPLRRQLRSGIYFLTTPGIDLYCKHKLIYIYIYLSGKEYPIDISVYSIFNASGWRS